jgi:AcrR family transcriptional regulator
MSLGVANRRGGVDRAVRLRPDKREQILTAAVRAFAAGGYAGTSTREIAEAAGAKEPLLFYHFGNKAALYFAAFEKQHTMLVEDLLASLEGQQDASARLKTFAEVYLKHHLGTGLGVIVIEFGGLPPEIMASISAMNDALRARLVRILADGVASGVFRPIDVSMCAHAILGLLLTFIKIHERGREQIDPAAIIAQVLDYYGAGLLPGATGISARMQQAAAAPTD